MRENITPINDNGQRHGLWERYWRNEQLYHRCVYINGKLNALEEWYWDGELTDKNYHL